MNIDIAISLLIIINVLKLVAGMEKCNVCYCETGKFGMSDVRWLYTANHYLLPSNFIIIRYLKVSILIIKRIKLFFFL